MGECLWRSGRAALCMGLMGSLPRNCPWVNEENYQRKVTHRRNIVREFFLAVITIDCAIVRIQIMGFKSISINQEMKNGQN